MFNPELLYHAQRVLAPVLNHTPVINAKGLAGMTRKEIDGLAEFVKTCARFRGLQSNVQYAEAFTACYAWPKVFTKRLLP